MLDRVGPGSQVGLRRDFAADLRLGNKRGGFKSAAAARARQVVRRLQLRAAAARHQTARSPLNPS